MYTLLFVIFCLYFLVGLLGNISLWKIGINDLTLRICVLISIGISAIGLIGSIICLVWRLLEL